MIDRYIKKLLEMRVVMAFEEQAGGCCYCCEDAYTAGSCLMRSPLRHSSLNLTPFASMKTPSP